MPSLQIPLDGRITSQNILSGPLTGGEVMEIVSPGNASQGNTYQVTTATQGAFYTSFPALNSEIITAGATNASPYMVETTDTRILFNKTIGSQSFAVMPLAASMLYPSGVFFKDLKGDAETNPINVTFTGGQLCDGLTVISIVDAYGWFTIFPVPGGTAWYMGG